MTPTGSRQRKLPAATRFREVVLKQIQKQQAIAGR